jgi:hypothetical protein
MQLKCKRPQSVTTGAASNELARSNIFRWAIKVENVHEGQIFGGAGRALSWVLSNKTPPDVTLPNNLTDKRYGPPRPRAAHRTAAKGHPARIRRAFVMRR